MSEKTSLITNKVRRAWRFLLKKENRVGALVLLGGLVTLIIMVALAVGRGAPHVHIDDEPPSAAEAAQSADFFENRRARRLDETRDTAQAENQEAAAREQPVFKKMRRFDSRKILGSWDMRSGDTRILAQFRGTDNAGQGGRYKMLIVERGEQYFSIGTYTVQEDLVLFNPDSSTTARNNYREFRLLTRSDFPLHATFDGRRLVLQRPDTSYDIYVPNYHPVLEKLPQKIAVLSPLS